MTAGTSSNETPAEAQSFPELKDMTAAALLEVVNKDADSTRRRAALAVVDARWTAHLKDVNEELARLPTSELYSIAANPEVVESRKMAAEGIIHERAAVLDKSSSSVKSEL